MLVGAGDAQRVHADLGVHHAQLYQALRRGIIQRDGEQLQEMPLLLVYQRLQAVAQVGGQRAGGTRIGKQVSVELVAEPFQIGGQRRPVPKQDGPVLLIEANQPGELPEAPSPNFFAHWMPILPAGTRLPFVLMSPGPARWSPH